jgi:hypothetical protein
MAKKGNYEYAVSADYAHGWGDPPNISPYARVIMQQGGEVFAESTWVSDEEDAMRLATFWTEKMRQDGAWTSLRRVGVQHCAREGRPVVYEASYRPTTTRSKASQKTRRTPPASTTGTQARTVSTAASSRAVRTIGRVMAVGRRIGVLSRLHAQPAITS